MNNFDCLVESYLIEAESRRVAIFPGAYKPPHKGHYQACAMASRDNDEVHIFIGNQTRDMITPEISKAIWDVFARTFPNVVVALSPTSPVKDSYELVDKLNKSAQANQYSVNLYADADDAKRFERIKKFSDNLVSIDIKETPRVTSARIIRDAITKKDWQTVTSLMPVEVDTNEIIRILKHSIISK